MSWFPDLGSVTMIDGGEHVRAGGWLSNKQPFPVGEVPSAFLGRLQDSLESGPQRRCPRLGCLFGSAQLRTLQ